MGYFHFRRKTRPDPDSEIVGIIPSRREHNTATLGGLLTCRSDNLLWAVFKGVN